VLTWHAYIISSTQKSKRLRQVEQDQSYLFVAALKPVPPEGTIPRCKHGHYAPDGDAYHCFACNPLRPAFQRNVVLPLDQQRRVKDSDKLFANAHDPSRCPKCHEYLHYELPSGDWECCECGTRRKSTRKNKYSEDEIEVAA